MRFTGLISALLLFFGAVPVDAVKVTIEKEMVFSPEGHLIGHRSISTEDLDALRASLISDYATFLVVEVAEEDLPTFVNLAGGGQFSYSIRRDFELIEINGYTFSSFDSGPALPQGLSIASYDGGVGLYLVQFKARVTSEWLQHTRSIASVIAYFPHNTFLVRTSPQGADQCRLLTGVQHVSLFQPAYKISSVLLDADRAVDVGIRLDGQRDLGAVSLFLEALTSRPVDIRGESDTRYTRLELTKDEIVLAAKRPEVLWIEPVLSIEPSGERQAMVVAGLHDGTRPNDPEPGATHDGYEDWLLEKGFCTPSSAPSGCLPYWTKVGVFDSGLNTMVCPAASYNPATGTCSAWSTNHEHPDFDHASNLQSACSGLDPDCYGPVLQGFFCAKDRSGDNQCLANNEYTFSDARIQFGGHGTASASIIASIPTAAPVEQDDGGYFRGTGLAPSAQLIVAKYLYLYQGGGSSDPGMSELEYEDLMVLVADAGARFASNSWNLIHPQQWWDPNDPRAVPMLGTGYTGFSAMTDQLVRDASGETEGFTDPMTIVFSAGNVPGFDNTWVTSPGNAKNVISVGATRGWSTTGAAGAAHYDCPSVDHEIDDICGGAGWSSRRMYIGEDDSGNDLPRFKPDLVAPGSQIAAARAQESTFVDYYTCFRGTSAAAPAVTAAAILADAWYRHVISDPVSNPSPAMVKAMLVAHADDMYGGYDHLTSSTIPHSPSPEQGWGRVNLDGLLQEDVEVTVYDEDHNSPPTRRFTEAGDYWSVELEEDDETKSIIAVMAFTDAASSPTESG